MYTQCYRIAGLGLGCCILLLEHRLFKYAAYEPASNHSRALLAQPYTASEANAKAAVDCPYTAANIVACYVQNKTLSTCMCHCAAQCLVLQCDVQLRAHCCILS
jgi:hypothetical protein